MIDLRINNVLHRAATFPNTLDLSKVSKIHSTPYTNQQYFIQDIEFLTKSGQDPELLSALKQSVHMSLNPNSKRRFINCIHHLDFTYNESRLFVTLSKTNRKLLSIKKEVTSAFLHAKQKIQKTRNESRFLAPLHLTTLFRIHR
jgi:hypothetical protein